MKPKLHRDTLKIKRDEELFELLVRPIGTEMHRAGGGADHKITVFKELSDGQRAAFMFWVLYSHAGDVPQFYTWIPYMRQPEPDYWAQLDKGMKLLCCTAVTGFIKKCDAVFTDLERVKTDWTQFVTTDLLDTHLQKTMEGLYREWNGVAHQAMRFIGGYMRANITDFAEGTE